MGALDGVRVIEIANWAAVPSTGVLLAEEGAEVIKIEPPSGDSMRGLMHQAATDNAREVDHPFQFSNRGKKSVAIDIGKDEGAALVMKLIGTADIVIMNLLRARRIRFGLTPDEILAEYPSAIIGVLTGFGDVGPDADVPGYDLTSFFARSGLSASIGGSDGHPPRWRAAQGDHVAGLALYAGLMTAMLQRERTGTGQVVETSLLQAATWSNAFDLTRAAVDGRPASVRGRSRSVNVTSECFRCADDRFVQLSLAEPVGGWRILCDVLGIDDMHDDPRFDDVVKRFTNMAELIEILDIECAKIPSATLVDGIVERGGVAALVMTTDEVVEDPQIDALGVLRPVDHPAGEFRVVAPPFRRENTRLAVAGIGAAGADTAHVLADILGLEDAQISDLEAGGVVALGPQRA